MCTVLYRTKYEYVYVLVLISLRWHHLANEWAAYSGDFKDADRVVGEAALGEVADSDVAVEEVVAISRPVHLALELCDATHEQSYVRVHISRCEWLLIEAAESVKKSKIWTLQQRTRFFSIGSVSITITCTLCSQTICQKSSTVAGIGPCVAMYSRWEW